MRWLSHQNDKRPHRPNYSLQRTAVFRSQSASTPSPYDSLLTKTLSQQEVAVIAHVALLRRLSLLAVVGIAVVAHGCGSGSGLVDVSGVITVDGKPVTKGRVEFFPESGRPAIGAITSSGRYRMKTKKEFGVLPGDYRVAITAKEVTGGGPRYASMEDEMNGVVIPGSDKPAKTTWLVPEFYANRVSSGLTATVVSGGEEINFELTSRPQR